MALARAAAVTVLAGRTAHATELLSEQLQLLRRVGTRRWVGETLEFTAMLLEQTGRAGPALAVLRDARAHRDAVGEPHGGTVPAVRDALARVPQLMGTRA